MPKNDYKHLREGASIARKIKMRYFIDIRDYADPDVSKAVNLLEHIARYKSTRLAQEIYAQATSDILVAEEQKTENTRQRHPTCVNIFAKKRCASRGHMNCQGFPGGDHAKQMMTVGTNETHHLEAHPYSLHLRDLKAMVKFCEDNDLDITIDGASNYNPGRTVSVRYKKRKPDE